MLTRDANLGILIFTANSVFHFFCSNC